MAPLPPNSTARVYFDYDSGSGANALNHTVQVRYIGPADNGVAAQTAFLALLNAIGPGNFNAGWSVNTVRVAPFNQDFSVPVPLIAGLNSFVGTDGTPLASFEEALEHTFQGRSPSTGRRVDLSLYGISFLAGQVPGDYRVQEGASGIGLIVRNAVTALTNGVSANQSFVAIDGTGPVWYGYMNVNFNSYWERRKRLG